MGGSRLARVHGGVRGRRGPRRRLRQLRLRRQLEKAARASRPPETGVADGRAPERVRTRPAARPSRDVAAPSLACRRSRRLKSWSTWPTASPCSPLVRGDHQLNETKLQTRHAARRSCGRRTAEEIAKVSARNAGSLGAGRAHEDRPSSSTRRSTAAGTWSPAPTRTTSTCATSRSARDFHAAELRDLRPVAAGDACPRCGRPLRGPQGASRSATSSSSARSTPKPMGAARARRRRQGSTPIMGCYGIGIERILAAAIELCHDKDGIIWPLPHRAVRGAVLDPAAQDAEPSRRRPSEIYAELPRAGIDVLLRRPRRARRREVQGRRPDRHCRSASRSARRASPRARWSGRGAARRTWSWSRSPTWSRRRRRRWPQREPHLRGAGSARSAERSAPRGEARGPRRRVQGGARAVRRARPRGGGGGAEIRAADLPRSEIARHPADGGGRGAGRDGSSACSTSPCTRAAAKR